MRLHINFDKSASYHVQMEDYEITYPRQHTMVLRRVNSYQTTSVEYIVIGFSKDKIFHCNIIASARYVLDLDSGLPFEEIESITFGGSDG